MLKETNRSGRSDSDKGIDPLQEAIEQAGNDPEKLQSVIGTLYNVIKETRGEAASRRKESKNLKEQLAQYSQKDQELKDSASNENTRLEQENQKLLTERDSLLTQLDAAQAQIAFIQAGASDVESLGLHWQKLSMEERQGLEPAEWAETMKERLPHLFQENANAPSNTSPYANTGPQSTPPPQQTKNYTKIGKHSSSDQLEAQKRRTISQLKY